MPKPTGDTQAALPTGTVTFVFSDIEGSTRLYQALGDGYPSLLAQHRELIEAAVGAHDGHVFGTEGDAVFAAFSSASAALQAAAAAQRALADHPWPAGHPIRVRMGIHTGEAILVGGDYVGLALHATARIAAAANGGQTLLSESTRSLIGTAGLGRLTLRDLGAHRLKDLTEAERLFQADDPERPAIFPALRTLEARPNNLPVQLTSFVGREELAEARRLLSATHLLTLTGPGGTGKTRLALQLAAEVLAEYPDGAFWVALDAITDPELIPPAVLAAIPLDPGGDPPLERLLEWLRERTCLVILDNFEQVVEGAGLVSRLLREAPRARLVVTTRIPLHAYGEQELPIASLGLPPPGARGAEEVARSEAVRLFTERAMAADPGFRLTDANAESVAEVVRRLDGLPLAVELAAARSRLFPPDALLARLDRQLRVLVGGPRDRPSRQQTLRGAIDWSYDLLDEPERGLFARFAVFAGGAFLAQAEAVCDASTADAPEVLDGLASLADKSLLRITPDRSLHEPRFSMLATIREYGLERLAALPEADELRRRHAEAFAALAEEAASKLTGKDSRAWLDRLALDQDNLRAALDWAEGQDEAEIALRLIAASWRFWQIRGHLVEARARFERVLALPATASVSARLRARAEGATGSLAYWQGNESGIVDDYRAALEQARICGEPKIVADALYDLSFISLPVTSDLGGQDDATGRAQLSEALELYQQLDDQRGLANVHWALAVADSFEAGAFASAAEHATESLLRNRALGDTFGIGWSLHSLGLAELGLHRPEAAEASFIEALRLFRETDDRSALVIMLGDFAALARERGDTDRAWRLAGACEAIRVVTGANLVLVDIPGLDWQLPGRPDDDPVARAAWQEGHDLPTERAIAYALGEDAG